MKKVFATLACCGVVVFMSTSAWGFPEFKKAFEDQYVKPAGNATMEAAFKKAGCNVCHVNGEKKNVQNAYGQELAKLIEGNGQTRLNDAKAAGTTDAEKAKLLEELKAAFPKVEAMKAPSGKTYGELLKAGSLPTE